MSTFVNFNNKKEIITEGYSVRMIKNALYNIETKNVNRVNKLVEGLEGKIQLSEAISLFTDKLGAMSALDAAKTQVISEGQFSWLTQDSGTQIGSERQNRITVYMYDNKGNQYKESKYDGYGEFGGMDYYELLARMNGYTEEDLEAVKGPFKEMRQLGIDIAFGKLETKDKGKKVLFPALVEDPRYNWKRHDFTQEAESDPNQSWYQEEEYDEEDEYYYEAKEVKFAKTVTKKEWDKAPKDYKTVIDGVHYMLVNGGDMGTVLAPVEITEGNAFGAARAKAIANGEKEFTVDGETYPVENVDKEDKKNAKEFTSAVTEAKFVKEFDKAVLDAETEKDILKVYPDAEFYVGKMSHFFGELEKNLFFKAYYADWYKKDTGKSIKGDFKITTIYSEKGSGYVNLYVEESAVTEAMFSVNDLKEPGLIWWYNKKGDKAQVTKIDKIDNLNFPRAKDAPEGFNISWGMGTLDDWFEKTGEKNPKVGEVYDITESVVTEGVMSEIDIIAKEAKNFKEFVKEFKSDDRYKGLDTVGDVKEFEAWLKSIYDAAKEDLDESVVTEGRVKQFEMDLEDMIKEIKRGYGWIDPEYVADTWENSSDSIDFELVKGEIYKRLIAAKLLAYASDENEEEAGTYIKSLKELGVKESVVTEKFNFSKKEVEAAANLIASAISQADMVKAKVHHLEYDKGRGAGFDISIDGEESAGGSYVVKDNGDVVNAAIGNSHPNAVYNTIGNKNIADVFINMEKYESVVNESEAENILNDLLDERGGDMGELHGMEMEDALDTVEAYGHKGSKAKKIAQELYSLCNESTVTEAKTISFAKASMMGSKLLNKISIGTILDTKGGQYEITGFGQQSNAFKEFEATIDGKEVKVKLTVMYGLKLEVTDDVRSARFNKEEEVNSIILESVVTENYEVIYSDGISQMKKFRNERQALDFMNKEIASNKKLRDIAVYKPGMHSTTQTELVVKFWGEGSYLDNVSKRDKDLAAKKLEESVVLCEATIEMAAMDPDNKDFLKFLKKNRVKIISKEMQGPGGGTPVITMQGKRKDLEAVLADGEYGWDDPDLAEYIEESAVTKAPLSWETLIERVNRPINENLRSKVKTYIKRNEDELNALADSDNWDVIYDKMRSEFDIEKGTEEDKDLIDTFKFTF